MLPRRFFIRAGENNLTKLTWVRLVKEMYLWRDVAKDECLLHTLGIEFVVPRSSHVAPIIPTVGIV